MSNIDFIMAIVIILGVISFSIYYVSGDFTTQLDQMSVLELKQSSKILENKLFNDLLKEDMKLIKTSFEEIGDQTHTETIMLTFSGEVDTMQLYDNDMNVTASGNPITFSLGLAPGEIKYFSAVYSGVVNNVVYNNAPNITARILTEQIYPVVSEEKCNLLDYNYIRETFNHNFKIKVGSCEKGLSPPQETVVARTVPVVLRSDILKRELANILVW